MKRSEVRTVPDVAAAVASDLAEQVASAVELRGAARICLAGGATPIPAYQRLSRRRDLPWGRVWVAWGDERNVPPDHPDRNERATREALIDHVAIPADQVLPWPWFVDGAPAELADAYADTLRRTLGDPQQRPWFDLVLLGLGADAHTASLFPGSGAVHAAGMATAVRPVGQQHARLTLTPAALSSARQVWFVASGEAKRAALERTLEGDDPDLLPASAITACEELRVYTDLEL